MKKHISLIVHWLINTAILYSLSSFYLTSVVLGNSWLNPLMSAIVTGGLVVAIDHWAKHINKHLLHSKSKILLFGYYFLVNTSAFWLLARIPSATGYGIARFTWAIILGVLVTTGQWIGRQGLKKAKLS